MCGVCMNIKAHDIILAGGGGVDSRREGDVVGRRRCGVEW